MKRSRAVKRRSKRRSGNVAGQTRALHSAPAPNSYVQPRTRVERFRVSTHDVINTTGGGNIFFSVPIDPTTTSGEWPAIIALYEEFRIMGGLITLVPSQALVTAGSSRANALAVIAYDQALFYTPASFTDLLSYPTRDIFNTQSVVSKPYTYGFRVPTAGIDNPIPWFSTTAAFVPTSCILIVSTGLTPSSQYFSFVLDFYLEFRTRS
jgi:hypothetical protein